MKTRKTMRRKVCAARSANIGRLSALNRRSMMARMSVLLVTALVLSSVLGQSTMKMTAKAAEYGLSNPTTGSDGVTTWDCIYFGNYWQNDTNGDGTADTDDEKEPIKWRVLSVDGDDAFLLADQNLDCKPYNETYTDVTWETCTLRSWLNGYGADSNGNGKDYSTDNFIDSAFSQTEQSAIKTTSIINYDNPSYRTEGGNDTQDKIYLLSIAEANRASYGFNTTFGTGSETRVSTNTAHTANYSGMYSTGSADYWWLRSPGGYSDFASYVIFNGWGVDFGYDVNHYNNAVRPALHLNLSSDVWRSAGKVTAAGGSTGGEVTPTQTPGGENPVESENPLVSEAPTGNPSQPPMVSPTGSPSQPPMASPTGNSSQPPVASPTGNPSQPPMASPTENPSQPPMASPTGSPSQPPMVSPTGSPSQPPMVSLTGSPLQSTQPVVTAIPSPSPDLVTVPSVPKVKGLAAKPGKKKLTVTWKKVSGADGYQLQLSTAKTFAGAGKKTIRPQKTTYMAKKLKAKKKYYIRIRAYKTYTDASGRTKKVNGKWIKITRRTK